MSYVTLVSYVKSEVENNECVYTCLCILDVFIKCFANYLTQ